ARKFHVKLKLLTECSFEEAFPSPCPLVGKGEALRPLPPRCRDGVNSPYLPACVFLAPGDPCGSAPADVRSDFGQSEPRPWGVSPAFFDMAWLEAVIMTSRSSPDSTDQVAQIASPGSAGCGGS